MGELRESGQLVSQLVSQSRQMQWVSCVSQGGQLVSQLEQVDAMGELRESGLVSQLVSQLVRVGRCNG